MSVKVAGFREAANNEKLCNSNFGDSLSLALAVNPEQRNHRSEQKSHSRARDLIIITFPIELLFSLILFVFTYPFFSFWMSFLNDIIQNLPVRYEFDGFACGANLAR